MKTQDYCENCGCKVYSGRCVNCHEELYIIDQYRELGMPLPPDDTDFMINAKRQQKEVQDCLDHGYQDWCNEQIEKNHQNSEQ